MVRERRDGALALLDLRLLLNEQSGKLGGSYLFFVFFGYHGINHGHKAD
jgi:hypothetical protein